MKKSIAIQSSIGIACATVIFSLTAGSLSPLAGADPTAGHDAKVGTLTPPMLCEIGSDDSDPGIGPNVVCQGVFVRAPAQDDQAFVTASGRFSYRIANIGVGYDHQPFDVLGPGHQYQIQGCSIAAGADGITFTNEDTGHGMTVGSDRRVKPF